MRTLKTLALTLLLAPSLMHAGAIEDLQRFNADTDGISGTFSQTVQSRNKTENTSGTFSILRPGRFKWEYTRPYRQTIVGDGRHIWLYDIDLAQVNKTDQARTIGGSPAAILSDKNALAANYTLAEDGSSNGIEYVLATPKNDGGSYQSIRIGFKNGTLAQMQLKDSFGNQTTIRFSNLNNRPNLNPNNFRFTPPAGVDVLEQ